MACTNKYTGNIAFALGDTEILTMTSCLASRTRYVLSKCTENWEMAEILVIAGLILTVGGSLWEGILLLFISVNSGRIFCHYSPLILENSC